MYHKRRVKHSFLWSRPLFRSWLFNNFLHGVSFLIIIILVSLLASRPHNTYSVVDCFREISEFSNMDHDFVHLNVSFFSINPIDELIPSFWRYNISVTPLSNTFMIPGSPSNVSVIMSSHTFLVKPHSFKKMIALVASTIDEIPAKHYFSDDVWIIVSKTIISNENISTISYKDFPQCYLTKPYDRYRRIVSPTYLATNLIYQINNEISSNFKPIKMIDSVPSNISLKYLPQRTAFVYSFITDQDVCPLSRIENLKKAEILSSIDATVRHTNRRVIILTHDVCRQDMKNLVSKLAIPKKVEVVEFRSTHHFPPLKWFNGSPKYRASFMVKSYYLFNINKYLGAKPIDRFIFLDLDCYLQSNVDHLFDLDVPRDSLIGGVDVIMDVPFNGGVFVSSPKVFDGKFEKFLDKLIKNFNPDLVNSVFRAGAHHFPHSEQEPFFYFFRKMDAYLVFPPEYNFALSEAQEILSNGNCFREFAPKIIHTTENKFSKIVESKSDVVAVYCPQFFYYLQLFS
ncbi:hypothetical protein RCL1_005816 [Eukaryota sp. TZLM3-RCL]